MNNKLSLEQDSFFNDDLLFSIPNYMELNEHNEFNDVLRDSSNGTYETDEVIETIDDDAFQKLLKELGTLDDDNDLLNLKMDDSISSTTHLSLDEQRKLFEIEKEIAYAKINLEREELEFERKKFERDKEAWQRLRKMSEESFQAEKDEYEKQMKIEKEKMYLETKEIINSCTNYKELLKDYQKIQDVSE